MATWMQGILFLVVLNLFLDFTCNKWQGKEDWNLEERKTENHIQLMGAKFATKSGVYIYV